MVGKCANPDCSSRLHYLRDGKLFKFEIRNPTGPCRDVPVAICRNRPARANVFFWLCQDCCSRLSVSFEPRTGVRIVPLRHSRERRKQDSSILANATAPDEVSSAA